MIERYRLYLNHQGGSRIADKIREACYWKGLFMQAICMLSRAIYIKTLYVYLPPRIITELKPRYLVHVDLVGQYSKSIRQQQPGGAIIKKHFSLTCMTIIDLATGWFNIIEIPMYDLDEITGGNDEDIDKSYAWVNQLFNNTWLCRYPYSQKVVFENRY